MRIRDLIGELKKFDEQDFVEIRTANWKRRQIKEVRKVQDDGWIRVSIELHGNR